MIGESYYEMVHKNIELNISVKGCYIRNSRPPTPSIPTITHNYLLDDAIIAAAAHDELMSVDGSTNDVSASLKRGLRVRCPTD